VKLVAASDAARASEVGAYRFVRELAGALDKTPAQAGHAA
jgi:hypothetical protein